MGSHKVSRKSSSLSSIASWPRRPRLSWPLILGTDKSWGRQHPHRWLPLPPTITVGAGARYMSQGRLCWVRREMHHCFIGLDVIIHASKVNPQVVCDSGTKPGLWELTLTGSPANCCSVVRRKEQKERPECLTSGSWHLLIFSGIDTEPYERWPSTNACPRPNFSKRFAVPQLVLARACDHTAKPSRLPLQFAKFRSSTQTSYSTRIWRMRWTFCRSHFIAFNRLLVLELFFWLWPQTHSLAHQASPRAQAGSQSSAKSQAKFADFCLYYLSSNEWHRAGSIPAPVPLWPDVFEERGQIFLALDKFLHGEFATVFLTLDLRFWLSGLWVSGLMRMVTASDLCPG